MRLFEVAKVFVVSYDSDRMLSSCEIVAPFLEYLDSGKELSVIYVIVSFHRGEHGRIVSTGVEVSI